MRVVLIIRRPPLKPCSKMSESLNCLVMAATAARFLQIPHEHGDLSESALHAREHAFR